MADVAARVEFLRGSQNADGGWGYFAGKQSWLEPTVFAAMALIRDEASSEGVARAWALVRGWQNADGGWRPNASVPDSTWGTALAVTLGDAMTGAGPAVRHGVEWLVRTAGAESSALHRALRALRMTPVERDVRHKGWPWRQSTSAWVEPTAHALVALRRAAGNPNAAVRERIGSGERLLLSVRCSDGGWNYGSPRALGIDLPSYPETTALALIGLGPRAPRDAYDHARRSARTDKVSPMARAWLSIALQVGGAAPADPPREMAANDVLVTALECLAAPGGNWDLLRGGNRT